MTEFTLKLSREKIQLLLSNGKGGFEEIGSADPNDSNITDNLKILRGQVNALTGNNPLIDVMLPDELILIQNLTIDVINVSLSKVRATALVARACDLKQDEINISLGPPTSHRIQPVAAVTTKTLDETRHFLNNAGFKTRRFMASQRINGFAKTPIFLQDKKPQLSFLNTKNAVLTGISIFTFLLFITAALFTVNPSKELKIANQIDTNVSTAFLKNKSSRKRINTSTTIFSINMSSMPNIINQKLLVARTTTNKSFIPTTDTKKDTLNQFIQYPGISKRIGPNQNILITSLPVSLKPFESASKQEKSALNIKEAPSQFNSIHSSSHNKYFSLHRLKATLYANYQKLIEQDLNQVDELTQINGSIGIGTPTKPIHTDFRIPKSFSQPRFISLASIDSRYLKKSFPIYLEQNIKIDANFKNHSTLFNQSVSKLEDTEKLLNRTTLSINLQKQDFLDVNKFNLTPADILKSKQYMPLIRPNLISKINVLIEPTLSSGAVTLSDGPLIRPDTVVALSRLNPNKVKIVARATKKPSFPRRASVANNATIGNIIELNRTNLIGVFGTKINAIALIRLASGRVIKVKVGDRFDGWKVLTIHKDKIDLANGKKQETLRLPG